ncbi:MAG: DUF4097 domain-containing protein [Actinomycetota bacterium]|nr:DUF4097 domain-containing protein [Actinomycetota bacterium]
MTAPTTTRRFPLSGPINLSVRLGHGSLTVRTADELTEAVVELSPGEGTTDLVGRMTVEMSGPTLVVHAPRQGGLADLLAPWRPNWAGGVAVVVTVPRGTALKIATFTGPITVHGRCGGADVATGSGAISLDVVDGDLTLRYGSAQSSVARVTGSATVRSGSGDARFGEVGGDLVSGCGSGLLQADAVHGNTRVRSGSGGARLGAVFGDVDLASGAGQVSIGFPAGVTARLDVHTGSGRVTSELPVKDRPAIAKGSITVRARTGSGDVRLFRSAA